MGESIIGALCALQLPAKLCIERFAGSRRVQPLNDSRPAKREPSFPCPSSLTDLVNDRQSMPMSDRSEMRRRDWRLETSRVWSIRYGAAHPTKLTGCRTFRRLASSRNSSRLAAKKRPNDRPFLSVSSRTCQLSALLPMRSRMPASSSDILTLPSLRVGDSDFGRFRQAWGVNKMISTRRGGVLIAGGSTVRGTCVPKPTAATLRLLNQPADWIECLSTRYLRTDSACS